MTSHDTPKKTKATRMWSKEENFAA